MKKILPLVCVVLAACHHGEQKTTPAATTVSADSVPPPPARVDTADAFDRLGPLRLGEPADSVSNSIGKPVTKSKAELWEADGLLHEDWKYPALGLELNFSAEKDDSPRELFSIVATSTCPYRTQKGLGVGSSYEEVMAAYREHIDSSSTDKDQVTVGTIYGGIIFGFSKGKAERVFLGAAAE